MWLIKQKLLGHMCVPSLLLRSYLDLTLCHQVSWSGRARRIFRIQVQFSSSCFPLGVCDCLFILPAALFFLSNSFTPTDILPPVRLHVLKVLDHPQIVPSTGNQCLKMWASGGHFSFKTPQSLYSDNEGNTDIIKTVSIFSKDSVQISLSLMCVRARVCAVE